MTQFERAAIKIYKHNTYDLNYVSKDSQWPRRQGAAIRGDQFDRYERLVTNMEDEL